jgi:hypothetical protein
MLVRMMEDTEVPFGGRAKIAQDLLDRAGLIATQVHQIVPRTEDPIMRFFEGAFNCRTVLSLLPLARHLGYGFLPVPRGGPCHDRRSRGRPPGSFATRCATDPTTASRRSELSERTEQVLASRDWLSPMKSVS